MAWGKKWFIKKVSLRDFPGGPVVKNPPCKVGDASLVPGQETKKPQAFGPLSLHGNYEPEHSGAQEPQLERLCAPTKTRCSQINTHTHTREGVQEPQLESLCAATKTQWSQINTHTHTREGVQEPQLESLYATTKTWCSQINTHTHTHTHTHEKVSPWGRAVSCPVNTDCVHIHTHKKVSPWGRAMSCPVNTDCVPAACCPLPWSQAPGSSMC